MVHSRHCLPDSFAIFIHSYPSSQTDYGLGKDKHSWVHKHLAYNARISNNKTN